MVDALGLAEGHDDLAQLAVLARAQARLQVLVRLLLRQLRLAKRLHGALRLLLLLSVQLPHQVRSQI